MLWRGDGDGLETAVVHRPRYDDWSLPKGKPEAGEHLLETAVREVAEETGFTGIAGRRGPRTGYRVADGDKQVHYWLMRCTGGEFAPNDEVDELRWLAPSDAATLVTHPHDRDVLADLVRDDVPRAPSVLLVRHASAGSRSDWDGPDDLRPLDSKGLGQARRLAEVLPHFGPTAVLTAERARCRQTVEPLGERLGLPLQTLPEVGEEEFSADPAAGLAAIQELLAAPSGVTVVCSQGGAIPSVLMALGAPWDTSTGRLWPPCAKGSVWVLGGRPGALSADYYKNFDSV